jgi:hypothetical protein
MYFYVRVMRLKDEFSTASKIVLERGETQRLRMRAERERLDGGRRAATERVWSSKE